MKAEVASATRAPMRLSSSVLVPTVLSVPTRTLLRLSVTTPINIARLTSLTTPRSREVSPALTYVSATSPSARPYLVTTPNFVACHVQAYLHMYDVTHSLRDGGTFLLNTIWEGEELAKNLPNKVKRYLPSTTSPFTTSMQPALLRKSVLATAPTPSFSRHSSASPRLSPLTLQ